MKKVAAIAIVLVAAAGAAYYSGALGEKAGGGAAPQAGDGRGGAAGGAQGRFGGGGGNFRGGGGRGGPMTVEIGAAARKTIAQELTVVGNLIGETTVSVAPRAAGRLQDVYVRLGDQVARGQRIARIEDYELIEQIKQQDAAQEVAQATIRQREADLSLAKTNVDRSRNLFERDLLPKQTLDDNEARYQSAQAQVDLARAQAQQSKARLDELQINLNNTIITSPVNGFIARRLVDPGASVGQNAPVVEVVDISRVRLIANVVEKDLKQLQAGDLTRVEVDAFPGETFTGRIARVSPVLDPATRTAPIEVEIPNGTYRLKPGMYARVGITLDITKDALVVPATALVDLGGRRGVFQPVNEVAVFRAVQVGAEQLEVVEILGGLAEGDQVITTGSGQLRDGDRVIIAGGRGGPGGRGRRGAGSGQPPPSESTSASPASPRSGGTPQPGGGTQFSGTPGGSRGATTADGRGGRSTPGGRGTARGEQAQAVTGAPAQQP